jgi:hypothetical protein
MHVNSFRFDASLVREFIEFGRTLYRDDARWIPPFRRTVARQLSPDYPFYNRAGNDHRHFLAYEGTQVVGRVSAMVNAAIRDEELAVPLPSGTEVWNEITRKRSVVADDGSLLPHHDRD